MELLTLQATGTPTALERWDEIGNRIIEVTLNNLFNEDRLIIDNLVVASGEMKEEIVLEESLEFLKKSFE